MVAVWLAMVPGSCGVGFARRGAGTVPDPGPLQSSIQAHGRRTTRVRTHMRKSIRSKGMLAKYEHRWRGRRRSLAAAAACLLGIAIAPSASAAPLMVPHTVLGPITVTITSPPKAVTPSALSKLRLDHKRHRRRDALPH